jgi:hypothetical protein
MRMRALACVLAVTASTLSLATTTTTAAPRTPAVGGSQVTLITGDVVSVVSGQISVKAVDPKAGFDQLTRNGDEYVIPGGAASLVAAGKLDLELFNVTGLIRQGYDDARSDSVPLLVEQAAGIAGARTERSFGELNLAAVSKAKKEPSWRQIADSGRKIWLNRKMSKSLDVSVPQVGAPAAWQAGHTGKGVTVAVLDTGIDANHPDVSGKVAVAKDFSASGSTGDKDGHGTHVASTIASGNASYKGVAPDAELAVGKVLGDDGFGQLDDIIAGMRWAVTEAKAKVVNMSLSGGESDGTDPVSLAVNELSRSHGALFVVAAGNSDPREKGKVSAPATADAALAVGNLTKGGAVSDFSRRGPRVGDTAMKPEISAPGSDIMAARASGGHVALSGTSMAAPHVAGAAAILVGQHPDWTGETIKSALVATASPVNAHPFDAGNGRVDLARATTSTVQSSPASVSANLKWPDTKPRKNTVTYRNTGTTPVTLSLAVDLKDTKGQTAPAALAKLSATTLTIAPGAQGSVTLTSTPRSGRPGQYGGALLATTADGKSTRTPVAIQDEPESYELTINAIDRAGKAPAHEAVTLVNLDTMDVRFYVPLNTPLRLPRARYAIKADIAPEPADYALRMIHPELELKRATTLKLDGAQAKPVSISIDNPTARDGLWHSQMSFTSASEPDRYSYSSHLAFEPRFDKVYAYSVPGVSSPQLVYQDSFRLEEPMGELFGEGPQRFEVPVHWWNAKPPAGTRRYVLAYGGQGRPEDLAGLSLNGKLVVLVVPTDFDGTQKNERIANARAAGAAAVAITDEHEQARTRAADDFPTLSLPPQTAGPFVDLAKAGGEATLTVRDYSKQRYELVFPSKGKVPTTLAYSARTADLATVTARYFGQTHDAPPLVTASKLDTGVPVKYANVVTTAEPASERIEYYTPGRWQLGVFTSMIDQARHQELTLTAGTPARVDWGRAVLSPGFNGTSSSETGENYPWAYRRGELMDITVPFYSDAAGHAAVPDLEYGTASGTTSLYSGDRLLGTQDRPGRGVFWVGTLDEHFRLTAEASRSEPWWPVSTKISSEWTFLTPFWKQGPDILTLPLLTVHAEPQVDLGNRAPAGPVTIPLTVACPDSQVTASSVELEFSTDDGATWQQAPVSRDGIRWKADVTNPADGFVSLRMKASDREGNHTVSTTVIRAYQV